MKEYVLITPNKIKNKIIEIVRIKYYNYNIKFMSLEDFIKKYIFDYNNKTIYYLMKEYGINLSSALVYLNNLYYISDKLDNNKMNILKEMKEYLDNNKLLIYNDRFREYIKDKEIYIYGYDYLDKYTLSILKDLNYKVIDYKYRDNNIYNIYEFDYIDDEVIFVIDRIYELLRKNIDINKIKLIISNEYKEVIYRLFKIYNLPISIKKRSIYSIKVVKDVLSNLDNIDNNLDIIKDDDIKDKVVKVLNNYSFINDKEEVRELIVNDLKNTYLDEGSSGIKISNINDYFEDDDYVFLLGFNKENIPILYKDNEYFNDKEKEILGYDTSNELNINKKIEVIKKIKNINNLIITYKLRDNNNSYTMSDLLIDVNIIKDYKISYNNSDMANKILLANKLDNLVKYNVKEDDLDLLYSNYNIPYMKYDNKYHNIDKDKLYKYLDNKLLLSYTAINNYEKCKFKYYISNILKINIINNDFNIIIGNVVHYILSHIDDKDFDIDNSYNNYLKSIRPLTNRELFILSNVKDELSTIIKVIRDQYQYMSLDQSMKEKEIYVNKDKNIKVTFKGVIDKVLYKEEDNKTYLVVIDYKTGSSDAIDLKNMEYGLNLQLPIYLYLSSKMELKNIKVVGFYLQKLFNMPSINSTNDYDEERAKTLKLEGYSINEENILSKFDNNYSNSNIIKSMKVTPKGFSSNSKVLSEEEINTMIDNTDKIIDTAIKDILEGDFSINPKVINGKSISCDRCEYKEICYQRENDIVYINREEDNNEVQE